MRSNGNFDKVCLIIMPANCCTLVTDCKLIDMEGRSIFFKTSWIRLLFPYRRGLISIKWLALLSISETYCLSFTLSVKNESSTIVPNLKGFSILRNFSLRTFSQMYDFIFSFTNMWHVFALFSF